MTYSARPYQPLTDARAAAVARGVTSVVVVGTLAWAGGALAAEEPAAAFLAVPGVQVWHWPPGKRPEHSSKMHAKLAVADSEVLLVSSANLTQSGIDKNIEAGLLVRGGPAPARAAEYFSQLQAPVSWNVSTEGRIEAAVSLADKMSGSEKSVGCQTILGRITLTPSIVSPTGNPSSWVIK